MGLLFGTRPFSFSDFFSLVKEGKVNLGKFNYSEVMMESVNAGFKHIEITGDLPYVLPGILTHEEINELIDIKKREKLSYSVHLPLWGIEPASFPPKVRKGAIETFIECIELTLPLDPKCWVLHPTGPLNVEFINLDLPGLASELMLQQFSYWIESSIKSILDTTGIDSRKIAIENIEFPFKRMESIIERLNLSICFDTGHLLAGFSGEISVIKFIEEYFENIVELHLHDGRNPRIDHKILGT